MATVTGTRRLLDISGNNIVDEIINLPLIIHSKIKELILDDLEIYDFVIIKDILDITIDLEKLSLSGSLHNSINDEINYEISNIVIPENLKVLDISWNLNIEIVVLYFLLEKLPVTIEKLKISNNYIGIEGCNILIKRLHLFKNLKEINLSINDISLKNFKQIFNKINCNIEEIDLSGNISKYSNKKDEYMFIQNNLPRLKKLKYFRLKCNFLNDYNAKNIIEGLNKTKGFPIRLLDLSYNNLTPRTLKLINMIYLNKKKILENENRDLKVLIANNKFNKNILDKFNTNIFEY